MSVDVQIRAAAAVDLESVCRLRLEFVADHRHLGVEQLNVEFVRATRAWLEESHRSGNLWSWVARVDGDDIGLASLALHTLPPRPEDHRTIDGRLLNVWVDPANRRLGIASALVAACLAGGAELGVRSYSLHATDDGRPLYSQYGFVDNAAWMERPGSAQR